MPHYSTLLDFLRLRAQASVAEPLKKRSLEVSNFRKGPRSVTSHAATVNDNCIACRAGKHPLFACPTFKSLPHEQMLSTLKTGKICLNCLRPGHFLKQCPSTQRCRRSPTTRCSTLRPRLRIENRPSGPQMRRQKRTHSPPLLQQFRLTWLRTRPKPTKRCL